MTESLNILVIEARFYDEVADGLLRGTKAALATHSFEVITVPGILELPATMLYAWRRGANPQTGRRYDGVVVLGCAVKGETDHYEHVCRESMSGVQRIALDHNIPTGNGILTCPTWELALNRADPAAGDAGGRAARACLRLIEIARRFGL
ncbi:MAG: 6,7-dimethyl-8-ribityllumazine synthase [Rhodospirillaceae bacterium]|nr:MAG: 6,7-dimethyl-8-ribityllumazine synthase [Rhodospirillaceae bacterium]